MNIKVNNRVALLSTIRVVKWRPTFRAQKRSTLTRSNAIYSLYKKLFVIFRVNWYKIREVNELDSTAVLLWPKWFPVSFICLFNSNVSGFSGVARQYLKNYQILAFIKMFNFFSLRDVEVIGVLVFKSIRCLFEFVPLNFIKSVGMYVFFRHVLVVLCLFQIVVVGFGRTFALYYKNKI